MGAPRVSPAAEGEGEPLDEKGEQAEREREGTVVEMLPRALYVVDCGPHERVVAHLSGHPRRNFVRVMTGDRVKVALSPRDRTRGRIISRLG